MNKLSHKSDAQITGIASRKTFEIMVKHINLFSKRFVVKASSTLGAKAIVQDYLRELPLDARHGTFDGYDLVIIAKEDPKAQEAPNLWFPPIEMEIDLQKVDRQKFVPTSDGVQRAFGRIVVRMREHLQMSQTAFCRRAQLSRAVVTTLEKGTAGIRLITFFKVAAALEKAPDDLLRSVANEYEKIYGFSSHDGSDEL